MSGGSMLFLNSWRVSSYTVSYDTNPPAIQKEHWHSREAQIEPPLIECECECELLEYRRLSWSFSDLSGDEWCLQRKQLRPQGLRAEKALASARILHRKFCGVNKIRPLNFNARNWFVLQNFLYLLLQHKVNFLYF
jgi:hypothetical protein